MCIDNDNVVFFLWNLDSFEKLRRGWVEKSRLELEF